MPKYGAGMTGTRVTRRCPSKLGFDLETITLCLTSPSRTVNPAQKS